MNSLITKLPLRNASAIASGIAFGLISMYLVARLASTWIDTLQPAFM